MIARPQPARWMRLLAVGDDLPEALVTLATHSPVEPEGLPGESQPILTPELSNRLQRFDALAQTYRVWWPQPEKNSPKTITPPAFAVPPLAVLDEALATLDAWQANAQSLIQRYQESRAQEAELGVLVELATALGDGPLRLDYLALEAVDSLGLAKGLFVLPVEAPPVKMGPGVLARIVAGVDHRFLLVVAPREAMVGVNEAVAGVNGRPLTLLVDLHGRGRELLPMLQQQLSGCRETIQLIKQELGALGQKHKVAYHIRQVERLQWFFSAIKTVGAGEALSRLGGWVAPGTCEATINRQLSKTGVRALATVSDQGPGTPPMVLVNPWWAQPFEFFPRLLGTPGSTDVDPSRLLAVVAPLLFGFMFGDVGQGLVVAGVGYALRRKLAMAWLLMMGGISAVFFGWMFGSFFCAETIIPPLWLHPTAHPMTVLGVPLVLGVFLILCGLGFKAVGAYWDGHGHHWLYHEGGVIPIYLGLLLAFFDASGWILVLLGMSWFVIGNALESPWVVPGRLAHLLETLMQLGVNTLSFARVGAFALAHAGLSQAVMTLAGLTDGALAGFMILVFGNLLILLLEGLVVSVQTTRLILFEFFVRFMQGDGRAFRPLPPPPE